MNLLVYAVIISQVKNKVLMHLTEYYVQYLLLTLIHSITHHAQKALQQPVRVGVCSCLTL